MFVLFFIWSCMLSLAPGRDHMPNAVAIATVVLSEPPLFKNDEDRVRTSALLVAIAFRESSFRNDVTSKTHDHCLFQINRRPDLASDPEECARVAMRMLRESIRMCREFPLSFYAEGPRGCESPRAQRISRDRMAIAGRLAKTAPKAEKAAEAF